MMALARFDCEQILKKDAFGRIEKGRWCQDDAAIPAIRRVYTRNALLRPLAKYLAGNELAALKKLLPLSSYGQVPSLIAASQDYHVRSYIEGDVLHRIEPNITPEYFSQAKALLRNMRRSGVCHNDLAKSANWLVRRSDNLPVLVDFQLALSFRNRRDKLFLTLCREDLRHLLKHKKRNFSVTASEIAVLKKKSLPTRIWMATGKKLYLFVTRRVLGWADRTGPEERNF